MPYESVSDAVAIANGTRYGLGASVWGPDHEQCLKVARQLECGMVSINDFGVFYVSLPSFFPTFWTDDPPQIKLVFLAQALSL